ncbi:MAG: hypothetical protein ACTSVV_14695 [Promethearchaeota archaeon]
MPLEKCESCGGQKRRVYEYSTKLGNKKKICQNCLMIHILFDDISEFSDEKQLDIFARLNSFYSYKSHQKEQNFYRLLLRFLWNKEKPDISIIKKLWKNHYKSEKDPIENYIRRFQDIGILGEINKDTNGNEIAEWGPKINLLLNKFVDARERNDIHSWYYDISNILKSAESLVGMSTDLDRPTFDRNLYRIMKLFTQYCCDKDGKILESCKKKVPLERGGYECNYFENGKQCGMLFDSLEEVLIHLNEHNVSKEMKEQYIKRNERYIGVWLRTRELTEQGDKITYKNWYNIMNKLLKDQDFIVDIGKDEWLIEAGVADAMEKALIKTKDYIKEKVKIKE